MHFDQSRCLQLQIIFTNNRVRNGNVDARATFFGEGGEDSVICGGCPLSTAHESTPFSLVPETTPPPETDKARLGREERDLEELGAISRLGLPLQQWLEHSIEAITHTHHLILPHEN